MSENKTDRQSNEKALLRAFESAGDKVPASDAKTPCEESWRKAGAFFTQCDTLGKAVAEIAADAGRAAGKEAARDAKLGACAAREMAQHYCELAKTHQDLAFAAKAGLYELAGKMQPCMEEMLELCKSRTLRAVMREVDKLWFCLTLQSLLMLGAVVYVVFVK